ncbi:MAG: RagB/SusD family nutrient uptake outer membrane protein [Saprospiraceae bacterium]|nr:RagB/SusD family nutrient uptake outer membrane protein [Saprospiraceae bacterium]
MIQQFTKTRWASLLIITAVLVGFSCSEFDLDEDPGKSQLAVLPYESIAELDLAVTGMYNRMWAALRMTTAFVSAWGGDDLTTHRASNKADFREYDQRAVTLGNARTRNTWRGVYQAIRAANTVLVNVQGVDLPDRATQDKLTGEAYFIRGMLFHHMARIHGRIALPLDIVPNPDITLASQEEVYRQIESDYLAAEGLLPTTSNTGATRPNAGTARAFLARLYMDWAGFPVKDNSKYSMAASSAKQVIDNAGSHGFALVPDMNTLYTLAGSANSEGVFTIAHCQPCGLGNRKTGKLGLPGDFGGWQESFAEIRFFEDMPEGHRKDATYHREIPLDAHGRVTPNVAGAASFIPWTEFKDQQNPVFKKITGPFEDNIFNGFQNSRSDYYMRYAEVLLTYAEASGRAGAETGDAWEALNMVRRRANGLPAGEASSEVDVTSGDLAEMAYTERKWELAGEYQRWYDLVRLERVKEALSNRSPQVSIGTVFDADGNATPTPLTEASNPILGSLETDNYFHPLPPDEVTQLPGLGGG